MRPDSIFKILVNRNSTRNVGAVLYFHRKQALITVLAEFHLSFQTFRQTATTNHEVSLFEGIPLASKTTVDLIGNDLHEKGADFQRVADSKVRRISKGWPTSKG